MVHGSCFMFPCFRNVFVAPPHLRNRSSKFGAIDSCFMFHVSGTCFVAPPQPANLKERGLTKMSKARPC